MENLKFGNHKITCPKCSHTRKNKNDPCLSVTVSDNGRVWLCHHCGFSGAKNASKRVYKRPLPLPSAQPTNELMDYFKSRGISEDVVIEMGIQMVVRTLGGEKLKMIAFPYYKAGELVNIKYRSKDKRFAQEKDAEPTYYNIDSASDVTIHVEGEIDVLSLIEAGYTSVISVPAGAPNTEVKEGSSKFDFIENCADQLERVKKHILAFDNDTNGNILKEEVAKRIGKDKCWFVDFDDCKDANEYLLKYGKEALRLVIENAKEYPINGVITFDKFQADLLVDLVENGSKEIYSTGWDNLDFYWKVRSQELTVVSGKPNNGKSLWLDNLLMNLAEQHGFKFLICSLEVPHTKHFLALLEKKARRARWYSADKNSFLDAVSHSDYEFISNHFFLYQTEDNDITIDGILKKAKELVLRKGIRSLVIDPHNQVEHKRPANMSEHEYIGDVLRKVRAFAKDTGCHVFYVAHPRKVEQGKTVTGYDISGSANWLNMTDNLIVIEREHNADGSDTDTTKIYVQKVRFQPEVGKQGVTTLKYIPKICRYETTN